MEKNKIPNEIDEFKNLQEKVHFLFYLSILRITTLVDGYNDDFSIMLNQYRELNYKSRHFYGGASSILLSIFDKYSCSKETRLNDTYKSFWKLN